MTAPVTRPNLRRGNALRRLITTPAAPPAGEPAVERCELCAAELATAHGHLVDLEQRSLLCCCRPCALLFTAEGAAAGRFRAVPDRVLRGDDRSMTTEQWDQLQIPVTTAFFFRNSATGAVTAFYPSPAGATESELPLDTWTDGLGASRLAALMEPDVEAILVRRLDDGGMQTYLVPIDACYELVGLVRLTWKGFDGGIEAHAAIDGFFAALHERSRPA
jgi:hypothetical protein